MNGLDVYSELHVVEWISEMPCINSHDLLVLSLFYGDASTHLDWNCTFGGFSCCLVTVQSCYTPLECAVSLYIATIKVALRAGNSTEANNM